ncbi:hypothetical protein D9M70_234660 [compost metagenome]
MNTDILRDLLRMLVVVRTNNLSSCTALSEQACRYDYMDSGRFLGYVDALRTAELITLEQSQVLCQLHSSACRYAYRPFPDRRNAGPFIYRYLLDKRNAEAVKQQAQVLAHEPAQEVSAPDTHIGLRLPRVLCRKVGRAAGHRVAVPQLPASRSTLPGLRSLVLSSPRLVHEAPASAPSAAVLAGGIRQRSFGPRALRFLVVLTLASGAAPPPRSPASGAG